MTPEGKIKVQKIDDDRWRIPQEGKMRTDGIIYAEERMFSDISKDQSLVQVANVAWLPGIVGHISMAQHARPHWNIHSEYLRL